MSDLNETKKQLNSVSPSFCLAKWTTVTLHLESGTTHSCHHPGVHEIPLKELSDNHSALHNTSFKIEQRKKMIKGERPKECNYCWNVEDLGPEQVSDRFLKSDLEYSKKDFDLIKSDPFSKYFKPRYVEVSFSNTCQFKCSYCSANYSSTWEEELQKHGQYPTWSGQKTVKTFKEEENAYIAAFWKWWPELKKGLHTFRITGGEPLLSPNTFKVLENLLDSPEPELNIAINSNLGAPAVLVEKFIKLTGDLKNKKAVKTLDVYTSLDAFGVQAEYIRHGLVHENFWNNVEKLLTVSDTTRVHIMCTFNALSVNSFVDLLKKIRKLNYDFRNPDRIHPVDIDISYLRYPEYQTVKVLPEEYILKMQEIVDYLNQHKWLDTDNHVGFLDYHLMKINRIVEWMKQGLSTQTKEKLQKDFYLFFSEHDKRRNTDFLKSFPEMKKFWNECKDLNG